MTIFFKGQIVSFSDDPRREIQAFIPIIVAALQQSYPERFPK